jgi:hypothetical protein
MSISTSNPPKVIHYRGAAYRLAALEDFEYTTVRDHTLVGESSLLSSTIHSLLELTQQVEKAGDAMEQEDYKDALSKLSSDAPGPVFQKMRIVIKHLMALERAAVALNRMHPKD